MIERRNYVIVLARDKKYFYLVEQDRYTIKTRLLQVVGVRDVYGKIFEYFIKINLQKMGIKDSFKKVLAKGTAKIAKTKIGKKVIEKAIDKHLEKLPEGQREMAKKVMRNMQNMSYEEQQEIAEKMKKLMGGKENPSPGEMMGIMRKMTPQQRKEYEELARKMMGM